MVRKTRKVGTYVQMRKSHEDCRGIFKGEIMFVLCV